MKLKKITYTVKNKKHSTKAKICDTIFSKTAGIMFHHQSPPLFFIFNKNKILTIHSLFCKPFRAIWLDEKMRATKILDVKKWKLNMSGTGKYLLEIPFSSRKNNRNI